MPVKINSSAIPSSPFELLRGTSEHPRDRELSFETELMEQQSEGVSHEEMEAMLKKIDEQAARLSRTPTYDELKEYRTLIKNFVGAAVSGMIVDKFSACRRRSTARGRTATGSPLRRGYSAPFSGIRRA